MPIKSTKKIAVDPYAVAETESNTNVSKSQVPVKRKTPRININKITEQKLIDEKLRRSAARPSALPRTIALAAALGFVAGGIFLVYYFFIKTPVQESHTPQIILPEGPAESAAPQPAETPTPPAQVVVKQVVILDTPTGSLNIRSGPGTNNPKIGEAKLGDVFDLVKEDSARGWYEIGLTATSTGWVTKQYSKIKE